MNLQAAVEPVRSDITGLLPIGDQLGVLASIYQPDHNIAIWQRSLSNEFEKSIQQLLNEDIQLALVQSVTPQSCFDYIQKKLVGHACAEGLAEDIALIVDMFCCLFDLKEAGLRLTTLDKPMCPKFHVDRLPCRLVTTYVGSATQWLKNDYIDRSKLGSGSLGQLDKLSGLYKSELMIEQMNNGDVALLKGSGWEGNEKFGLVHRSPALALCERRLLLTLDMI